MSDRDSVEGVVLISEPALNALTERQRISYREHRRKYVKWLVDSYAEDTRKVYASILDQLHRYIWVNEGGFTTEVTHDHADDFLTERKESDEDYSTSYLDNIKLAIKSYFEWKGDPWETDIKIEGGKSGVSQPKDYLTKPERQKTDDATGFETVSSMWRRQRRMGLREGRGDPDEGTLLLRDLRLRVD